MESKLINALEIDKMMRLAAFGTDIKMLSQIFPYLEGRKEAAKRYMEYGNKMTEDERNNFIQIVQHHNAQIKIIMAL